MGNFNDVLKYNYKLRDGHEIVAIMNGGKEALLSIPDSIAIIHAKNPEEYVEGYFNPSLNELAIKNFKDYLTLAGKSLKSITWHTGTKAEVKLDKESSLSDTMFIYTDIEGVAKNMARFLEFACTDNHLAWLLTELNNPLENFYLDFKTKSKYFDLIELNNEKTSILFWDKMVEKKVVSVTDSFDPLTCYKEIVYRVLHRDYRGLRKDDFLNMITAGKAEQVFMPLAHAIGRGEMAYDGGYSSYKPQVSPGAAIAVWADETRGSWGHFTFPKALGGDGGYFRWVSRNIDLTV